MVEETASERNKRRCREWYQKNREAQLVKKRAAHHANKEEANAKRLQRYYENRDESRAKMRKWYADHREEELPKHREWHAKNREMTNAKRLARHYEHREEANMKRGENSQKARLTSPWKALLKGARDRAKERGLPFTLTEEWAKERWTGACELTGIPFKLGLRGNGAKVFSPSIDQIRPKIGYTPENCRFILWAVNALKHDGTDEDMYFVARALAEKMKEITDIIC